MAERGWEVVDDWGVEPDDHIVERAKNAPVDPRHFSLNKDPYYSGYDAVRDEDKQSRWSDVGQALKIGAINTAEAPAIISDYMTSGAIGSEARREAELTKRDILNEMTPQGRRAATAPFLGDKDHEGAFDVGISDYLMMGVAQNAAPMMMSLIPGWLASEMAAGAGLGLATRGAIGAGVARGSSAVQNMADVNSSIMDTVETLSDQELKNIPRVQQFIDEGMSFSEAKGRYRTEVAGSLPFVAAVIGAVGAFPEASFIKTVTGASGKKGIRGALGQIGGGAAEEFGEEGSGAALSEIAGSKAGLSDIDYHNIISSALGGAAQGGVLHAPTALVHLGADAIAPEQRVALSSQTSSGQPAAPAPPPSPPPAALELEPTITSPKDAINVVNTAEIPEDLAEAIQNATQARPANPSTPASDLIDETMSAQLPPNIANTVPTQRAPINDEADAWEAFDNWGAENTPDVIRYDDGRTEEIAPTKLRRKGSPQGWMTPATESALRRREAALATPVSEEPSEEEYWDELRNYKAEQAAQKEEETPVTSEVMPDVKPSDGVAAETTSVAGAKGRKARRTPEQIAADKEAKAAVKAEKAAAKEAAKTEKAKLALETAQKRAAKKAARSKAPSKAKSKKSDAAPAAAKPPAAPEASNGVIQDVYVNLAKRLADKKRVSAEGSHESNVEKAKRATKKKVAEEEFYNPEHQSGEDAAYVEADQADLLRGDTTPKATLFVRSEKQRRALKARLQKFVKAVEDRAGEINPNVTKNSSNYELYARVAKDVLKYIDNNTERSQQALDDFIADELAARKGDFKPMRKRRLEEGDQQSRPSNQLNEETNSGATASIGAQSFPAPDEIDDVIAEQRKTDYMNAYREILARKIQENSPINKDEIEQELAKDYPDVKIKSRNPKEIEAALRAMSAKENAPKEKSGGAMTKKVTAKVTEEAAPQPSPRRTISQEENDRYVQMLNDTAKRDAERSNAPKATPIEEIPIWEKEREVTSTTKIDKQTLVTMRDKLSAQLTRQSKTLPLSAQAKIRGEIAKLDRQIAARSEKTSKVAEAGIFGDLPTQNKPKKPTLAELKKSERKLYSMKPVTNGDITNDVAENKRMLHQVFSPFAELEREIYGADIDVVKEYLANTDQGELFEPTLEELKHRDMQDEVNHIRKEAVEELDESSVSVPPYFNDGEYYGDFKAGHSYTPMMTKDGVKTIYPVDVASVGDLLKKDRLGAHRSKLYNFVRDLVIREAGETDIITLTDKDFRSIAGDDAGAFYSPSRDTIFVPDTLFNERNHYIDEVILHEALHAALHNKLKGNNVAIHQLELLSDYLAKKGFMPGAYMYADVHEFLSEILSRGDLQEGLRRIELTPELAQILGIEPWRAKNLWQAIVQAFSKWLGYVGPYNALEGVLSVTDRILNNDTSVPKEFATNSQDHYFDVRFSDYYGDRHQLGGGYDPSTNKEYYTNMDGAVSRDRYGQSITGLRGRARVGWDDQLPSIRRENVTSAVKDQSNATLNKIKRFGIKAATLDQLRQSTAGLFVDRNGNDMMEKLVSTVQRMAPFAQKLRDRSDQLAKQFSDLKKSDPDMADRLADLAMRVTMAKVSVGPGAKNNLGNGGRNAQSRALLGELEREYNSLSPEAQKLYSDMAAYYRTMQNEHARGIVENRLQQYEVNPRDRQGFIDRAINGKLDKADENLFKDKGKAFERIKEISQLRVIQGDYFPMMRYGKFIVNTRNKINDLMGGTEIEPGKVEFRAATEKAARTLAEAFAANVDLPQTNFQKSPTSQANDFGFIVSVQRNGAHFFESEAEAMKWRRENAKNFDEISEVSPIRETGKPNSDLTTGQLNSLMATVKNSNYSDEEKEAMLDMLKQGSAVLMSGNRIQKRSVARRDVLGASNDFSRNVLQYGQAASSRLAQLKFRPAIDEALNEMREINKNLMDKEAPKRTAVMNEVSARIDEGVTNVNEPGKFIKDLMTLTFLGKLASPMYSVIQTMQPGMVTYPVLAGKFNPVRAAAALHQAYSSIGFSEIAMAGIANTYRAGKNFTATAFDTTDTVASIKKNLAKDADGAELNTLIDELLERGAMSSGGFELAQAISQGRSKYWGVPLAQVDRIARQLPKSIEDINRAVSAVAAYRLARSSMTEEKARAFAFDTVMNTQGDYSSVNAPRIFNKGIYRPALQFKKYAQMMGYLLADMTHRAFGPGTEPKERKAAFQQLLGVMGVQIAMAGALSLPGIEIAKVGFMVAGALGLGGGWDDEEEKLRKLADDTFGKTWGELITRGVVSRAINIDLSQRLSLADMVTFGEPGDFERDGVDAYLWRMFAGAPYSTINDIRLGVQDAVNGDLGKAAERIIPVKVISDAFKAANRYSEGKATTFETAINAFGVKSGRQAEKSRDAGNDRRAREKIETSHKELTDAYLKAKTAGERVKLRAKIIEFNKTAPLRQKVFPNSLDKVRQRIEAERVS